MTIRVYRSDDAGAPVLNGVAGSLIGVLDACLVVGYGTQTAAGWAKAFSGTNLAAYRAAVGNRMYLRVDDTPAQFPVLRGYEAMTGISAGTGPFHTDAQAPGCYACKSSTADTAARPWIVLADEQAVYVWVNHGGTVLTTPSTTVACCFFGDIVSYKPADQYATMLVARSSASVSTSFEQLGRLMTSSSVVAGYYLARNSAGVAGAVGCNVQAVLPGSISFMGLGGSPYPDPVTGRMNLALAPVVESNYAARGHLPGLFNPLHNAPGTHLDTITGLDGETYLILRHYPGQTIHIVYKITGSWRT